MDPNLFWIVPFHLLPTCYNNQYPIYLNHPQPSIQTTPFYNNQLPHSQQETLHPNSNNTPPRKQRKQFKRRTESELNKSFKCPYDQCSKSYGSDLALNLHMKNKHNGGTKKERDRRAKQILKSQMEGRHIPTSNIQLPPGYIEANQIRLLLVQSEEEEDGETVVKKEQ